MAAAAAAVRPYKLLPLSSAFGAQVLNVSLPDIKSNSGLIEWLRKDLDMHALLLFRDQGQISGAKQVEISQWWGELESTFYKHPKSPHPDVFRVSNDETQGCTGVGRSGWHCDGTFQPRGPFAVQTMHFWSVNTKGDTLFVSMSDVVRHLSPAKRRQWQQLYFITRDGLVHPLIFPHHRTGQPSLVIHTGQPFVAGFAESWDPQTRCFQRMLSPQESKSLLEEMTGYFEARTLRMRWRAGDFAVIDNRAVVHYASPGTQAPVSEAGLRILHRTTVACPTPPMHLKLEEMSKSATQQEQPTATRPADASASDRQTEQTSDKQAEQTSDKQAEQTSDKQTEQTGDKQAERTSMCIDKPEKG